MKYSKVNENKAGNPKKLTNNTVAILIGSTKLKLTAIIL